MELDATIEFGKFNNTTEECMKKNIEVIAKLEEAMRVVQVRLDFIRTRIQEINAVTYLPREKGYTFDGEIQRKVQFTSEWNDSHGCPPNPDTVAKQRLTGLPSQVKCRVTNIWTPAQSRSLCLIIHKLEVQERIKLYSKKKYELKHLNIPNADLLKISELQKEIAKFNLTALKKTPLEELVASGKGIYDWEEVADFLRREHTPLDCKTRWFQYLHPNINKAPWTKEEDARLTLIAERRGEQDWEAIAAELGTRRSAYSCFTTYQSRLRGMQVDYLTDRFGVRVVECSETGWSQMDRSAEAGWTRNDDCALATAVTKSQGVNGIAWDEVMEAFPNKSRKQLFARWSQVLDPSLRKGNLTYIEQKGIIIGTRRFGLDFSKIRNKLIPHRTVSQIRHYTLYRINNCGGRGKWGLFAEQVFRALIEYLGPGCWREVRSFFPYNSVIQLKRRYQMLLSSSNGVHSNIYLLPKQVREALSEPDLHTCKLICHWENIKPLHHIPRSVPEIPAGQPFPAQIAIESENAVINCDTSSSESDDEDSNQVDMLQENCVAGSSKENEFADNGALDEIVVSQGCKRRCGRPPSKKKKKQQTEPKRAYVRSGQYKIVVADTAAAKRSLRQKRQQN